MLIKNTDVIDKKSVTSQINQCNQCSERERESKSRGLDLFF